MCWRFYDSKTAEGIFVWFYKSINLVALKKISTGIFFQSEQGTMKKETEFSLEIEIVCNSQPVYSCNSNQRTKHILGFSFNIFCYLINIVFISLAAAGFWFCLCSSSENKCCFWASSGLSKRFWDVIIEISQVHLLPFPPSVSLPFLIKMHSLENVDYLRQTDCIALWFIFSWYKSALQTPNLNIPFLSFQI